MPNPIPILTLAEGAALVEDAAQRAFGLTATEFVTAYKAGALDDPADHSAVMYVVMLLPLAGWTPEEQRHA